MTKSGDFFQDKMQTLLLYSIEASKPKKQLENYKISHNFSVPEHNKRQPLKIII